MRRVVAVRALVRACTYSAAVAASKRGLPFTDDEAVFGETLPNRTTRRRSTSRLEYSLMTDGSGGQRRPLDRVDGRKRGNPGVVKNVENVTVAGTDHTDSLLPPVS